MDEITDRQWSCVEYVLIAVGLVAALLYIRSDGDLLTPYYILYGMGAAGGWMGFAHKLIRAEADTWWILMLVLSLIPAVVAVFSGIAGHVGSAYSVLASYGLLAVGIAGSRYARRRAARRGGV